VPSAHTSVRRALLSFLPHSPSFLRFDVVFQGMFMDKDRALPVPSQNPEESGFLNALQKFSELFMDVANLEVAFVLFFLFLFNFSSCHYNLMSNPTGSRNSTRGRSFARIHRFLPYRKYQGRLDESPSRIVADFHWLIWCRFFR